MLQYQEKAEHMRTKDYEIGFIVVSAVAVITLVLISFVTPTVTVAAQIVSYLFPQSVDADFIPLSIEEDSDTSKKPISTIIRFFKRECHWHTTM